MTEILQTVPDKASFAALITTLRKRRRLLQAHVARELSMDPSTVSQWERGERVPNKESVVHRIAELLEARPDERALLLHITGFTTAPPSIQVVRQLERFILDPTVDTALKARVVRLVVDALEICQSAVGMTKD